VGALYWITDYTHKKFFQCQYVQNGLTYSGKETRPKLCLKGRQGNSGISSLETNKHQLLHRIQSNLTFTNLQYNHTAITKLSQVNLVQIPDTLSRVEHEGSQKPFVKTVIQYNM